MGYETVMQSDVLAMLGHFRDQVPDIELHDQVHDLIADSAHWSRAKGMFDHVRGKFLANERSDHPLDTVGCHCLLLEVCLKAFFNETYTDAPFDSCSPYWIIKNALCLARSLKMPIEPIVSIVAPYENPSGGVSMTFQ